MTELIEYIKEMYSKDDILEVIINKSKKLLDKEKEQIQKAFSDGQEIPINHPTLPHYSSEEYYNHNYN